MQPSQQFSHLSASLERHMAQYGYHTVETSVIQSADLFLTRAGDQIIEHLFTFERRGKQYALRPEFTASAAALYAAECSEGTVARWQFHGTVFEDDPAGNGGTYQHYASGAELLGLAGPLAEAEIIAMAAHGLSKHGIHDWQLVIGNVQLVRQLLSTFQLDSRAQRFLLGHVATLKNQGKTYVLELLDKLVMGSLTKYETAGASEELNTQQLLDVLLDATQHGGTMGGRTRHDIVRRLLQKRQRAAERDQFMKALDFLEAWSKINGAPTEAFDRMQSWIAPDDAAAQAIFDHWKRLLDLLDAFDIPMDRLRIQPALARNWDYYTGMVFELTMMDNCRLGGGGRYDELARLLGAQSDVPAVGFTYYADEILKRAALEGQNKVGKIKVVVSSNADDAAVRWCQLLRHQGYEVAVESNELVFAGSHKPASAQSSTAMVLTVQPDGSIEWDGTIYPLSTAGNLIARMENQ